MKCLSNAAIFDGVDLLDGGARNVFVNGEVITEISDRPPNPGDGEIVDCAGLTILPGLIDAHIHAFAGHTNLIANDLEPITYVAQHANAMLRNMLDRGFTTARDCGGADHGLVKAIADGRMDGPNLFICGKMLSQSGGHGDLRNPMHGAVHDEIGVSCGCGHAGHISVTADGVTGVLRAARENFRRGATFIKFAASGGVGSLTGSVTALQFSDEEVRAIVQECERQERYCTAHVHPDAGIRRVIELGVHCIEHASLIEPDSARLAADRGVFLVPTLSVAAALKERGAELGLARRSLEKLDQLLDEMLARLVHMRSAGCEIGFGTDLLGVLENEQRREFDLRSAVFTPLEILRQATSGNARLLRCEGEIGVVKAGARADLAAVRGDPLSDISLLGRNGPGPELVMARGQLRKAPVARA